ncbi:hypothetical protein DSO57_1034166 [Entomophthora muscae]|uniref:Uncharacterized protein n=1 Tax=Entomophthora muscae TaxID=34485 RepID=A0ACC2RQU9_9FUNG|nr:hypothetical protein DSO57_1034166 [Entomophthora muscae]
MNSSANQMELGSIQNETRTPIVGDIGKAQRLHGQLRQPDRLPDRLHGKKLVQELARMKQGGNDAPATISLNS